MPDTPPNLDIKEVKRLINAHTPVEADQFPAIDMKTSLAAEAALVAQKSAIPKLIREQGEKIFEQWRKVLEPIPDHPGKYVITDDLLRGLIARAGITSSILALLASGAARLQVQETSEVEQVLASEADDATAGDGLSVAGEVAPPAI